MALGCIRKIRYILYLSVYIYIHIYTYIRSYRHALYNGVGLLTTGLHLGYDPLAELHWSDIGDLGWSWSVYFLNLYI